MVEMLLRDHISLSNPIFPIKLVIFLDIKISYIILYKLFSNLRKWL